MNIENEQLIPQQERHQMQEAPYQVVHPGVADTGSAELAGAANGLVNNILGFTAQAVRVTKGVINSIHQANASKNESDISGMENDADREMSLKMQEAMSSSKSPRELANEFDSIYMEILDSYSFELEKDTQRFQSFIDERYTAYYKKYAEEGRKAYDERAISNYDARYQTAIDQMDYSLMTNAVNAKAAAGYLDADEKALALIEGAKGIESNILINAGLSGGLAAYKAALDERIRKYGDEEYPLDEEEIYDIEKQIRDRNLELQSYKKQQEAIIDNEQYSRVTDKFGKMITMQKDENGDPIMLTYDDLNRAKAAGLGEEHYYQMYGRLTEYYNQLEEGTGVSDHKENDKTFADYANQVTVNAAMGMSKEDQLNMLYDWFAKGPFTGTEAPEYYLKLLNFVNDINEFELAPTINSFKEDLLSTRGKETDVSGNAETFGAEVSKYLKTYREQCSQQGKIPDNEVMRRGIQNLYEYYSVKDAKKLSIYDLYKKWSQSFNQGEGAFGGKDLENIGRREQFLQAINNGDLAGYAGTSQQEIIDSAYTMQRTVMDELMEKNNIYNWTNKYDVMEWPSGKLIFQDKLTGEQYHLDYRYMDGGKIINDEILQPISQLFQEYSIHRERMDYPDEGTVCSFGDNNLYVSTGTKLLTFAEAEREGLVRYEKVIGADGEENYIFYYIKDGKEVLANLQNGVIK